MCSTCSSAAGGGPPRPEILAAFDAAHALFATHRDAALFGMTDGQVLEAVESREALVRCLDTFDVALVGEVDGRDVAGRDGAASTAMLLRDRLQIRPGQAHARVRLAAALDGQCPATRQALTDALISADHAGIVVSVVRRIPSHVATVELRGRVEEMLVDLARTLDPGELAKAGRALLVMLDPDDGDDDTAKRGRRTLSMHERDDGMTAVLDPEGAAVVAAALDPLAAPKPSMDGARDPRPAGRRRCEALIELCRQVMNDGDLPTTGGERPHVSVLVPFSTLTGTGLEPFGPFGFGGRADHPGGAAGGEPFGPLGAFGAGGGPGAFGGTGREPGRPDDASGRVTMADGGPAYTTHGGRPLPKGVVDRIVCDASVRRIVFGPAGEPLNVGRTQRTVNAPIRAAVVARDQMCSFPGCDRPPNWAGVSFLPLVAWDVASRDMGRPDPVMVGVTLAR